MIFRKKSEKSVDLKEVFGSAEWPRRYDVTIHMNNGEDIRWTQVRESGVNALRKFVADGEGCVNLSDDSTGTTVTVSAQQIAYLDTKEVEYTMWTEDQL